MRKFYRKLTPPYRNHSYIPFEEPLRSEIRRFLIALDAYQESYKPLMSVKEILMNSTQGESYNLTLKRIKKKSYILTAKTFFFEEPDWWNDVPGYVCEDIGQVFNYNYSFFWKEEDPLDYLNGMIPLNQTRRALRQFRKEFAKILPDYNDVEKVFPEDILFSTTSSSSYLPGKGYIQNYKIKSNHMSFSKKRMDAHRCRIPVGPCNYRDTIINQIEDLNTISLIEQQNLVLLEKVRGHIHLRDEFKIKKGLNKFFKTYEFFLQRDLKKEGITKPRSLLNIMMEELHKKYPDFEAYSSPEFFNDFTLILEDGTRINPIRGHGLGMANTLTTLMQLTIHNMVVCNCHGDNILLNDVGVKIINDDITVGCKSEEDLESYWDEEGKIFEELDLLREPTKSFKSHNSYVIAERYFPLTLSKKDSYLRNEMLSALAATNIVEAKQIFSALQCFLPGSIVENYFSELIAYWGYEFTPNEVNYPSICGGWMNPTLFTINKSLTLLENVKYNSTLYACYQANKVSSIKLSYLPGKTRKERNKTDRNMYISPLQNFYGDISDKIPKEYHYLLNIETNFIVDNKFKRIKNMRSDRIYTYYSQLLRKRLEVFRKHQSDQIPFDRFIKEIISDNPTIDFYPIKIMIKKRIDFNFVVSKIRDLYRLPNPISNLLYFYGIKDSDCKERYNIEFIKCNDLKEGLNKQINVSLRPQLTDLFSLIGDLPGIPAPKDPVEEIELMESYLNPIHMSIIHVLEDFGFGIPIIYEEYRSPIIEFKKDIYGKILTLNEEIELSRFNTSYKVRLRLLKILEHGVPIDTILQHLCPEPEVEEEIQEESDSNFVYQNMNPDDEILSMTDFTQRTEKFERAKSIGAFPCDDSVSYEMKECLSHLQWYTLSCDPEDYLNKKEEFERLKNALSAPELFILNQSKVLEYWNPDANNLQDFEEDDVLGGFFGDQESDEYG